MKKKIFSFILTLALILTGTMFLAACGGKTPSFNSLKIEYQGQEYESVDLGEYQLGQIPNPDYKVKAYYSDGSVKELTTVDYAITYQYPNGTTSNSLNTNTPGNYSIKITFKTIHVTLNFEIQRAEGHYTLNVPNKNWRYKQLTEPLSLSVTTTGGAQISENVNYYYVSTTADATAPTETELENRGAYASSTELTPGTYFLFAEVGEQATTQAGTTNYVKVTVGKGELTIPQEYKTQLANCTWNYDMAYTGSVQTLQGLADNINALNEFKGTVVGNSTEEVNVRIAPIEPNTAVRYSTNANTQQFKFVSTDSNYEVRNADFDMNITVIRKKIIAPTIDVVGGRSTDVSRVALQLVRSRSDYAGVFHIEKRVGENGQFENFNFTDNGDMFVSLETLTSAGEYTYRLMFNESGIFEWDFGDADTTGLDAEGYILLTWDIEEFDIVDLEWYKGPRENQEKLEDNCIMVKGVDTDPYVQGPDGIIIVPNTQKWFTSDGEQLEAWSSDAGSYYVEFEISGMETNGHYIVKGDKTTLNYRVANGADVAGKNFVFADLKLVYAADGSEVAEGEEELAGWIEMTKNMCATNLGTIDAETGETVENPVAKTAKCELDGTVSGTCDFCGGTFDELKNPEDGVPTPFRYTYDASRDNTVEMYLDNGEDSNEDNSEGNDEDNNQDNGFALVGNFDGNTLTLTTNVPTNDADLIWVFTFTLTEETQA